LKEQSTEAHRVCLVRPPRGGEDGEKKETCELDAALETEKDLLA